MDDLKKVVEIMAKAGVDSKVIAQHIQDAKGADASTFIAENILITAKESTNDDVLSNPKAGEIGMIFLTACAQGITMMPEVTKDNMYMYATMVAELIALSLSQVKAVTEAK